MWRNKEDGAIVELDAPPRKVGRFWIANVAGALGDSRFSKGFDWMPDKTVDIKLQPGEAAALAYVMRAARKAKDDNLWRSFSQRFVRLEFCGMYATDGIVVHLSQVPVYLLPFVGRYSLVCGLRSPNARRAWVKLALTDTLGNLSNIGSVYAEAVAFSGYLPKLALQSPGDWLALFHWSDAPVLLDAAAVRSALDDDPADVVCVEIASNPSYAVKLRTANRVSMIMPLSYRVSNAVAAIAKAERVDVGPAPGKTTGIYPDEQLKWFGVGMTNEEHFLGANAGPWTVTGYSSGVGRPAVLTPAFGRK